MTAKRLHKNALRVVEAARAAGLPIEPREFDEHTRTVDDAARAIGVGAGQIVKSLVFLVDGEPVVALMSGPNRLDEKKLANAAGGGSVARADANAVRDATSYPVGGVPPLGYPAPLRVFVDRDLLAFDEVWAAAGTPHCNFAAAPEALVSAAGGVVVDIAAV